MICLRWTILFSPMMFAMAVTVGAQTQSARTASTDSLAVVILRMPFGARIRFVMHGGERTLANDPRVENDSMVVKINGHTLALPLAQIDTLWVMNGRNAGRGVMIVGIPFAIVGAVIGTSFACDIDSTSSCHDPRARIAGAGLFATILGAPAAVAGAVLGLTIIRWKRVFVRTPL